MTKIFNAQIRSHRLLASSSHPTGTDCLIPLLRKFTGTKTGMGTQCLLTREAVYSSAFASGKEVPL